MLVWNSDIQKISIWFLIPAFIVVLFVLPVSIPLVVFCGTFAFIISLEIFGIASFTSQQCCCLIICFGINPRSPPVC